MLEKYVARVMRCELKAIGILLLVMAVLALMQVVTRYVFFYSIVWLEELSRYCMILMTLIGASVAVDKENNIAIDILPSLLRDRLNITIAPALHAVICIFSLDAVYYAVGLTVQTVEYGQKTPAMRIPMGIVYGAMAFSYMLMAFHAFARLVLSMRKQSGAAT